MNDTVTVTGMVLSAMPIGEYDKRLLLLSRERGKISAFAKGCRKPSSPLVGASRLFSFGSFELYEGRSSYTVKSAAVSEHFDFLSLDMEAMCYASYFSEFADYYGREGTDGSKMLKLLCVAFLALKNEKLDRRLIRSSFELKAMQGEGEYFAVPRITTGPSAAYAWQYVLEAKPERAFGFALEDKSLQEFTNAVEDMKEYYIDRTFRSLEILSEISRN